MQTSTLLPVLVEMSTKAMYWIQESADIFHLNHQDSFIPPHGLQLMANKLPAKWSQYPDSLLLQVGLTCRKRQLLLQSFYYIYQWHFIQLITTFLYVLLQWCCIEMFSVLPARSIPVHSTRFIKVSQHFAVGGVVLYHKDRCSVQSYSFSWSDASDE